MTREIADSDAEDEELVEDSVEDDRKRPAATVRGADSEAGEENLLSGDNLEMAGGNDTGEEILNVNFDDFISQSQRESQGRRSEGGSGDDGGRSTVSKKMDQRGHLQSRVGPDDSPSLGRRLKRRFTDGFLEGGNDGQTGDRPTASKEKRHKSYGNSRRHGIESQSVTFMRDDGDVAGDANVAAVQEGMDSIASARGTKHVSSDQSQGLLQSTRSSDTEADGLGGSVRRRKKPVLANLHAGSTISMGTISTSTSSMGEYQSINIDLRGAASGLDVDANPFGSASQVSVDEDPHVARVKGFFRRQRGRDQYLPAPQNMSLESDEPSIVPLENGTEAHLIAHTVDPSMLMHVSPADYPNDTQLLSSSALNCRSQQYIGRAKSISATSHLLPSEGENPSTLFPSEASSDLRPETKRGRKPNTTQDRQSSAPLEDLEVDELNSDELTVGLPKQRYQPRPTRSRDSNALTEPLAHEKSASSRCRNSRDKDEEDNSSDRRSVMESQQNNSSSPVKHPTSELNLSDEATIGLPKEHYNPRPSRSRSKKIVENVQDKGDNACSTKFQSTTQEVSGLEEDVQQEVARVMIEQEHNLPTLELSAKDTRSRGKKKAKVKRAKTTLPKKSEQMLSEGDEDVVWMETKPAKVKMESSLPQLATERGQSVKEEELKYGEDLGLDNKEATTQPEFENDPKDHDDDGEKEDAIAPASRPRTKGKTIENIAVEIPPPHVRSHVSSVATPNPPVKLEPKKRGRKRKQTAEAAAVVTDTDVTVAKEANDTKPDEGGEPITTENKSSSETRPALTERDTNAEAPPQHQNRAGGGEDPDEEHDHHSTENPPPGNTPPGCMQVYKKSPHSPIKDVLSTTSSVMLSSSSSTATPTQSKYRVGLSRRVAIPPLLRVVRKDSDRPPAVQVKKGKKKVNQTNHDAAAAASVAVEGGDRDGKTTKSDAGNNMEEGDGDDDGKREDVNRLLMMEEEYYSP